MPCKLTCRVSYVSFKTYIIRKTEIIRNSLNLCEWTCGVSCPSQSTRSLWQWQWIILLTSYVSRAFWYVQRALRSAFVKCVWVFQRACLIEYPLPSNLEMRLKAFQSSVGILFESARRLEYEIDFSSSFELCVWTSSKPSSNGGTLYVTGEKTHINCIFFFIFLKSCLKLERSRLTFSCRNSM